MAILSFKCPDTQRLFTSDVNVRNVRCFFSVHRAKSGLQITLPSKPRD